MTFSIVAYDPGEQAWGIAVASKFLAVGAVVPWARAGVGAVATQAYVRMGIGPAGLDQMAGGLDARSTLDGLLFGDPQKEDRQVGMVDRAGIAAAFTGVGCYDWAGHHVGEGFTCQGNVLAGPQVITAMVEAYQRARGELADRLVAAVYAGDRAGGDRRGRQSAAVLVVRPGGGYGGDTDRYLDLRVDDDADPVVTLQRLLASHHVLFGDDDPAQRLPIDAALAAEFQTMLARRGYYTGPLNGAWDGATKKAFWDFCSMENLEDRWTLTNHPDRISPDVLAYIRQLAG